MSLLKILLWDLHNEVHINMLNNDMRTQDTPQRTKFMGPTWGPPGSCGPHVGPINFAIRVIKFYYNQFHRNHHCQYDHHLLFCMLDIKPVAILAFHFLRVDYH